MAEMNDTKATNSTDAEVNYKEDLFCWTIEGVGILIIGLIGVFGNSCSMVLFSRQKVHRIFHHLLLLLSVFDLVRTSVMIVVFCFMKQKCQLQMGMAQYKNVATTLGFIGINTTQWHF